MPLRSRVTRKRSLLALTATGGLLTAVGFAGMAPMSASASSHREAPMISGLPQYDATDLYAFRSPEALDTVTLVANWLPFEEPAGGPNFYSFATDAHYDINISNDGDALAEVVYRWTFKDHYRNPNTFLAETGAVTSLNDENLNYYQTYKLQKITKAGSTTLIKKGKVVPSDSGKASMPDYGSLRNAGIKDKGNYKSFAGQADDPFFLDLRVFDLLYGGDFSEVGDDTLAGFGVQSVALQVPRSAIAKKGDATKNPIIGLWTTTSEKNAKGKYTQISRLGMPLVNEVVAPVGGKDYFNASQPKDDAQFLDLVTKPELPKLVEAVYGVPAPAEPRNDLVAVFLTGIDGLNQPKNVQGSEMLRLNMSTPITASPNRLGVIGGDNQGFPNGRRLADDIIDISLQVVEGELTGNPNDLGDGVDANDTAFSDTFPYVALPKRGSDDDPHPSPAIVKVPKGSGNAGFGFGIDQNRAVAGGALGLGLVTLLGTAVAATRRRKVSING